MKAGKRSLDSLIKLLEQKSVEPSQVRDLIEQVRYPSMFSRYDPIDLSKYVGKDNHIRIGVIGDTQLNSVGARSDHLSALYDIFKRNKCGLVLHPGDFSDGIGRYKGHAAELKSQYAEEVVEDIILTYPRVGIPTYFIGGNDDRTYLDLKPRYRRDICAQVARHRKDLHYLGLNHARVKFKEVVVELNHPRNLNRGAYTASAPLQKLVECYQGGSKPDILLVGGYHRFYSTNQRGIKAFLVGAVADQTATMVTKRHVSYCGGLILDIELDSKGQLKDMSWTFVPLYR